MAENGGDGNMPLRFCSDGRHFYRRMARFPYRLLSIHPSIHFRHRYASDLAIVDVERTRVERFRPQPSTVLRTIGKHSITPPFSYKDVKVLCRLIDDHQWSSKLEKAVKQSGVLLTPNIVVEVIRALAEAKQALRFFIWAGEQDNYQQSLNAVAAISRRWSNEKHFEAFLTVFDNLRTNKSSLTSDSFLLLIMGYCWAGMVEKAAITLDVMKDDGCIPAAKHFNCLLAALGKEKRFTIVPNVYQQMVEVGFYPDTDSFKTVVIGFCKSGQTDEAFNLLKTMKSKGLSPDLTTYTMIVEAFCKSSRYLDALRIIREMAQKSWDVGDQMRNVLVRGLAEQSKIDEAHEILYEMIKKGSVPNLVTLTDVFNSLCEGGKLDKALKLWNKINKDRTPTATFHGRLMDALCKAGRIADAEKVFMGLKASRCAVNSTMYNVLIQSLSDTGKIDKACKLLFDMDKNIGSCDAKVYNSVVQGLYKVGKMAEATRVVKRIGSKCCDSNSAAFQALMVELCKVGNMDGAVILLSLMKKAGFAMKDVTYNLLLCTFCKAGQLAEACRLFQHMTEQGSIPDESTCDILIEGLRSLKADREAEFNRLTNEMGNV